MTQAKTSAAHATAPSGVAMFAISGCPYCARAEKLLRSLGARVEKIMVDEYPAERARMQILAMGRTSAPQIFIGGEHLGGCDDLVEFEQLEPERLRALLKKASAT